MKVEKSFLWVRLPNYPIPNTKGHSWKNPQVKSKNPKCLEPSFKPFNPKGPSLNPINLP